MINSHSNFFLIKGNNYLILGLIPKKFLNDFNGGC